MNLVLTKSTQTHRTTHTIINLLSMPMLVHPRMPPEPARLLSFLHFSSLAPLRQIDFVSLVVSTMSVLRFTEMKTSVTMCNHKMQRRSVSDSSVTMIASVHRIQIGFFMSKKQNRFGFSAHRSVLPFFSCLFLSFLLINFSFVSARHG